MDKILDNFKEEIDCIEADIKDVFLKAKKGIKSSKYFLLQLRDNLLNYDNLKINDEILFFKSIKPKVYSKLIYYVQFFKIEQKRPIGSTKSQKKYLQNELNKLELYFKENSEFHHYIRSNETYLDSYYFVRCKEKRGAFNNKFNCCIDANFTTSHDTILATFLAYKSLIDYIQNEIDSLDKSCVQNSNLSDFQTTSLFWTGTKVDLVEFIYALQTSGVINKGIVDIKELAIAFEILFNIQLGDYYRTFIEIRSRKINNTKFLDTLKEKLIQRMEESDN